MKTMKYSKIGGRLLGAMLVAILFVGCQKDSTTLTIQMRGYDGAKAYMYDHCAYWSIGDEVLINNDVYTISGDDMSFWVADVTPADEYYAIFPIDYIGGTSDMAIPNTQIYNLDSQGRQLVKAPMGAYTESSSLVFYPMGSMLAVTVTNNTTRGAMVIDKVVVKASAAALWGDATLQDFETTSRSYTIDAPYSEYENDAVTLCGENGASMNAAIAANGAETFYITIPAIPSGVNNKFTITVYATTTGSNPTSYSYTLSQQNDNSGNIPNGMLVEVPFSISADNEAEVRACIMYYTSYGDDLSQNIENIAMENHTSVSIQQVVEGSYAAIFDSEISTIGEYAFLYCNNLASIAIPVGVTTIGQCAFMGCTNLVSVSIPSSVTTIEEAAFGECSSLATITIPNSVTYMGRSVFGRCVVLDSVTIGNGVTSIEESAFLECMNLTLLTIGSSVRTIGYNAFRTCEHLISVTIPNSVTTIGDNAFYGCFNLADLTLGNNVTTIGRMAFSDCAITSLTIPNSVITIGTSAFSDCSIASLTIGNSVSTIGQSAFRRSSISHVIIPSSVTFIGKSAFEGCSNLTSVTSLATTPPQLEVDRYGGSYVFRDIDDDAVLHVPSGSVAAYQNSVWQDYFTSIVGDASASSARRR